jgi:hypothetical protein
MNFIMDEGQPNKASYRMIKDWLVYIKYDPNNFFRVNQNIVQIKDNLLINGSLVFAELLE